MDKKKLIGTIIGVTLFAALIAGATFAWLTFSANVTNGEYDGGTMEFKIDYVGGGSITEVPILGSATSTTAAAKEIRAYRTQKSPDGTLTISLTTDTNNILTTNSVIKYAVCSANNTANCTNLAQGETGVLSAGTITTGTQVLYQTIDVAGDEIAVNTSTDVANMPVNYIVYLWLDGAILDENMVGKEFSGYIHASASQDAK